MYYRVAIQVHASPTWQWKSTLLSSLDALFQWFRLYHALPQQQLRVFSSASHEGIEEQFVRENQGLASTSVTAAQFLRERRIRSHEGEGRGSAGREHGRRGGASLAVATTPSWQEGVPAAPALFERGVSSLERRRQERERGAGGDHDRPYTFTLPAFLPLVLAWCDLRAKLRRGEIEPERQSHTQCQRKSTVIASQQHTRS
jgi:hypothetical protein